MGPKHLPIGIIDAVYPLDAIKSFAAKIIHLGIGLRDHIGHIDTIRNNRWS